MKNARKALASFAASYGMLAVLGLLCLYFSWATYRAEAPTGASGAALLSEQVARDAAKGGDVVIVTSGEPDAAEFTQELKRRMAATGHSVRATI